MKQPEPDLEELFFAALEIENPAARAAFLQRHAVNERAQREIEELLALDSLANGFLESPPLSVPQIDLSVDQQAGTKIGPYKLIEPIGDGGMGIVWMAEQSEPVRRKVALKVIKPGMDTKQVLARFEAERQALAMMDHPNIARVFDGGTTAQGRPFFVMELVRGIPITDYCDRERLVVEDRLNLFMLVCRAVQHAHQKGIIHRDLKPTNILVTVIDGEPVPKVIDFGVAKAIGDSLTDRTLCTGFHQFVGTPMYMSPEQAALSGVDIDTRSDIYSLGVLLYELLTGTTPFDSWTLKQATFDEMRRMIREDEPLRPSLRLSSLGDTRTTVADARRSEPRRLGSKLKGELDWIVMKALEKDRKRRYESSGDLAADVGRYLSGSPVAAVPASRTYRFRKFARRHQVFLSTVSVVGLTLASATSLSTWLALRAIRAERNSEASRILAEHRLQFSERHLYASRLRDARKAIDDRQVELAQEILKDASTSAEGNDLRDFAWHYLQGQATRDIVVYPDIVSYQGHFGSVRSPILLEGDQRIAYDNGAGEIAIVDMATGQLSDVLKGNYRRVEALAVSPDGRTLVSAGKSTESDQTSEVLIRSMPSGAIVGRFDISAIGFKRLRISNSGRILYLGTYTRDGMIFDFLYDIGSDPAHSKLLGKYPYGEFTFPTGDDQAFRHRLGAKVEKVDLITGKVRKFALPRSEEIAWCEVSPDGAIFAQIDGGRSDIVLNDTATGAEIDRIHACEAILSGTSFLWTSDHAATVVMQTASKRIFIWDRTSRTTAMIVPEGTDREESSVVCALSADGRYLALTTWGIPGGQTPVRVFDVRTGEVVATFSGRHDTIHEMKFAPDGQSIYLIGGHAIKQWKLFPAPSIELAGHQDEAWCLAFTPDSRYLLSGSDNSDEPKTLKLWSVAGGELVTSGRPHLATLSTMAISPDGQRLVTGGLIEKRNLRLFDISFLTDAKRWKDGRSLPGRSSLVRTVAFSPDGKTLAKSGDDRKIHLFDGFTMAARAVLSGHTDKVRQIAFSPDGKTLASAANDGSVRLWDLASRSQIAAIEGPRPFTTLAFSPDGTTLAVGDQTGLIRFLDPVTLSEKARVFSEDSELRSVAYSPDGRILAAAGMGKTIRLWDTLTHQNLLDQKGHEAQINALAFSPDGATLASCDHAGKVKLWTTRQSHRDRGQD
ncbi:protein kinase [bacterium]|nr:protein kinase [bacterium]